MTRPLGPRHLAAVLIPGLAMALYYEWSAWRAVGVLGFPYDDAWIHAQFARNIATGQGFSYTGGRAMAGSTAPAWTTLLAVGYMVASSVTVAAKVLGILLQLASGLVAAQRTLSLTGAPVAAVASGLMVVLTPVMVLAPLAAWRSPWRSSWWGCHLYLRDSTEVSRSSRVAGLALLTLSCLARPENLVLLVINSGAHVLSAKSLRAAIVRAAMVLALAAVILGPVVRFDYATIGRPLPTTFYAKSGPGLLRAIEERNPVLARRALLTHAPAAVGKFAETLHDQFWFGAMAVPFGMAVCLVRLCAGDRHGSSRSRWWSYPLRWEPSRHNA